MVASASNTVGTVAGLGAVLLSTQVVNAIAGSSLFLAASAATGGAVPAAVLAYAACGIGSMLVNYGITHWAEVKNLNDKVADWWPVISTFTGLKTEDVYPVNKTIYTPLTEDTSVTEK